MQLSRSGGALVASCLAVCAAEDARAEGELSLRAAYYKERATRVTQPMIDVKYAGEETELATHFLVDTITSASAAAGAVGEPFTETRIEAGGSVLRRLGQVLAAGGGVRYSSEPDYKSLFFTGRARAELGQRNTTVGLAAALGFDDVSNASSQGGVSEPVRGELKTMLGSLSVSQVLSPRVVAGVTYDLIRLHGFQQNPYRTVVAGGVVVPERVPERRLRHALFGSARGFLPSSRTIIGAGYRFYADSWGITGHTPELRVIQQAVDGVFVHLRFRHHIQSGADFYREIYDSADPEVEPFLAADPKLSPMTSQTYGIKLEVDLGVFGAGGRFARIRTEALFELVRQSTSYGNALNAQLALVMPFDT